nr:MAG TPA: hypothetical protein [Caudoviricetes sp.]
MEQPRLAMQWHGIDTLGSAAAQFSYAPPNQSQSR